MGPHPLLIDKAVSRSAFAQRDLSGLQANLSPQVHVCYIQQTRYLGVMVMDPLGTDKCQDEVAVGQNQWYHFGIGAPPILVYFSGDWDVHWGYGILTHGQEDHGPHPFSP